MRDQARPALDEDISFPGCRRTDFLTSVDLVESVLYPQEA